MHIRISLGTKFQLKLTILIFWTKFAQSEFPVENGKIAFARASMVVTYYIKHFRTEADRHNGNLISLLLLVADTKMLFPKALEKSNEKPWVRFLIVTLHTSYNFITKPTSAKMILRMAIL